MSASEIPPLNGEEIRLNKIQVIQSVFTSPGFWATQRFLTKELSFCIKMSDPPLSYEVLQRPIFLLMRLAVLWAKWQLAFLPELMAFFSPFLLRHKGKKITSISVPICCPSSDVWPCFIWFHLFTFITVIHFDLLEWPCREVRRLLQMALRNHCHHVYKYWCRYLEPRLRNKDSCAFLFLLKNSILRDCDGLKFQNSKSRF